MYCSAFIKKKKKKKCQCVEVHSTTQPHVFPKFLSHRESGYTESLAMKLECGIWNLELGHRIEWQED